jgi:hypothetical protein
MISIHMSIRLNIRPCTEYKDTRGQFHQYFTLSFFEAFLRTANCNLRMATSTAKCDLRMAQPAQFSYEKAC